MRKDVTCPYCKKNFTTSFMESETISPIMPDVQHSGFWASMWTSDIITSIGLGSITWIYCYTYNHYPIWSVIIGVGYGLSMPLIRIILSKPIRLTPNGQTIKVHITETPLPRLRRRRDRDSRRP